MGSIINYFVSSQRHGRRLLVAGVNGRVLELFRMTKVEGLLTMKATVAEAEQAV
jgi:anti-sigma B factor antagonist